MNHKLHRKKLVKQKKKMYSRRRYNNTISKTLAANDLYVSNA